MKNQEKRFFLLLPLRVLTAKQRVLHALLTYGLPLTLFAFFFSDLPMDVGREIKLLFAISEGIIGSLVIALIEHLYFKLRPER